LTTQAAIDVCQAIDDAIGAAHDILGRPLLTDLTCPATAEITPVIVVNDNDPAFKSIHLERYVLARAELRHVRTRKKRPQTNSVVECFNPNITYADRYRDLPLDGVDLTERAAVYRELYNTIRPHEGIDLARPHNPYTATITPATTRQPERIP
jgi:putative transposase